MAVVADRIREGNSIPIDTVRNDTIGALLHPRSMIVVNNAVVPEGFFFIGVLYGYLQRIVPSSLLPWFVTIIGTLVGSIAIKRLLEWLRVLPIISEWSAAFYPVLPPILYYTFHPFLANLLQVNILLVAVWMLVRSPSISSVLSFVAGALIGTAVALRPVEALWILPLVVIIMISAHAPGTRYRIVALVIGALIPLATLAIVQRSVFGSWWSVGYAYNPSLVASPQESNPARLFWAALFPFGIHPFSIVKRTGQMLEMFWWWLPLVVLGLRQWLGTVRQRTYSAIAAALTVWLLVYYGSWQFSEPEDTGVFALSTGFVRYLIPVWMVWLPILVSGIMQVIRIVPAQFRSIVLTVAVSGFVLSPLVLAPGNIIGQHHEQNEYRQRLRRVLETTPSDAILLVKRSDKVYYPFRQVIVWYKEPQKVVELLAELSDRAPVYLNMVEDEGAEFKLPPDIFVDQRIRVSSNEQLWRIAVQR